MSILLCPSMMCADYGNLAEEVCKLEEAGIDIFHIDIMDGNFVPNFGMGLQDAQFIAKTANIPMDVHLMIQNPGNHVKMFAEIGAKIIYIHPEADTHPTRTLEQIANAGAQPALAINPGTAVETIMPLLFLAEYVMVMTVNPGFAGQKYLSFVDEKIGHLLQLQERYNYKIMIDGACSQEKIKSLSAKGVNGFVLGTAALFGKDKPYAEIIPLLREQ